MESLILNLCGLWFWLTRKYRATQYSAIAGSLNSARVYLWSDYATRASTRDRGAMLPHQVEALTILERHGALVSQNSRRFDSLSDCCKFVAEELAQQPSKAA
jgi:hypothetical protein